LVREEELVSIQLPLAAVEALGDAARESLL
jgi:hypothetical protein